MLTKYMDVTNKIAQHEIAGVRRRKIFILVYVPEKETDVRV